MTGESLGITFSVVRLICQPDMDTATAKSQSLDEYHFGS